MEKKSNWFNEDLYNIDNKKSRFENTKSKINTTVWISSLVDILQNLNSKKEVSEKINSDQKVLVKAYNAKLTISDETIIAFIKWLEYFKNQGGEIVFTGGFDMNLMDIASGNITELKIEDGKVKVSFVLDDGTIRTDEVELKDTFCPDFSFHCK